MILIALGAMTGMCLFMSWHFIKLYEDMGERPGRTFALLMAFALGLMAIVGGATIISTLLGN